MTTITTYDIKSQIEQGTINVNGDAPSDIRVRSADYIFTSIRPKKITINAIGNKPVQVEVLGYTTDTTNTAIFNLYWYDSGYEFDVSEYADLKYIRVVLRNLDNSTLSPANISFCEVVVEWETTWYMSDRGIWNTEFAELLTDKTMEQPYPKALWRMHNGKLTTELFDTSIVYGAFANATELSTIRIPESVKKIGVESFAHTQLTSVTVARDCKYYETSFPVGCDINFYD